MVKIILRGILRIFGKES